MKFLVVILCSLIASVSTETAELDNYLNDKCHNTFNCYIPKMCDARFASWNLSMSTVKQVTIDDQIVNNCVAVVRFYGYNTKWVHVVMESRNSSISPPVSKISLNHDTQQLFSCEAADDQITARYFDSAAQVKINEKESSLKPLKCVFEVKQKGEAGDFQKLKPTFRLQISSSDTSSETKDSADNMEILFGTHCDPQRLKYSREYPDQRMEYSKAEYSVGKLSCKEGFTSEYLPKGKNAFVPVALSCKGTKFMANEKPLPEDEDIAIRCAADARYSCPYEPKRDSSVFYRPSVREKSKEGEIKCLEGKLMFVRGKYSPGKIACLNREFSMRWVHIPHSGNETILHKTSPLVECRTELACNIMNPIKRRQVKKGTLVNHLPQCANERGKLKLGSSLVKNVTCDSRTGRYMVTLNGGGGAAVRVEKDTEFECDYSNKEAEEAAKKEGEQKQINLISISLIVGLLLLIGIICAFLVREYRLKKRAEADVDARVRKHWGKLAERKALVDKGEEARDNAVEEECDTRHCKPLPSTIPIVEGLPYLELTPAEQAAADARGLQKHEPFDFSWVEWNKDFKALLKEVKEKDKQVAEEEAEARQNEEKEKEKKE